MKIKKRWKINPANKDLREVLGRKLNILPLTAQLLINRGLVEVDKAFSFLTPELKDLHDPFLLKDMDRAAERIHAAIGKGEKIAVYGDYDVDGVAATALVHLFFKEIGVDTVCYIPDRHSEGYGVNIEAVKELKRSGVRLIITVDCGSSNHEEISFANSLGLDVIVTDHHELTAGRPPAFAVINPKQSGCAFPFKGLAGVGVAFNLIMAVRAALRSAGRFKGAEPNLKRYLDLVAIGTVADMVPLLDENRIFVSAGLKELECTRRPGLKALKEAASVKPGRCDADVVAFCLAPRINAAGRLTLASTALSLLVTDDHVEAARLAGMLEKENQSRQKLEEEILNEALGMLGGETKRGIVLVSENWHPGVIGIVASRLVDRFAKPAVMIAFDKKGSDVARGSARGVKSFNILEGIKACASFLEKFGGHKAAAGLTLRRDKLEGFKEAFLMYLNHAVTEEDLMPEITLDAAVSLDELDLRVLSEIETLAPFGMANSKPIFCLTDARIIETEVVKQRHLRFKLKHNGCAKSAIGFGLAGLHPLAGDGFNVAFSPYADEWQGVRNLGLHIKDVQGKSA